MLREWASLGVCFLAMTYAGTGFAQMAGPGTGQAGAIDDAATEGEPRPSDDSTEIVVTGTLVRGIAPVGSDVVTVSSNRIEETGAASVAELLQSIPQLSFNNLQFPPSRVPGSQTTTNRPNLRGLTNLAATGSSTTLVLVDGHRVVGMGVLSTTPDPDILPPATIERVEIVFDGGSSIYGSDAVAGVMNFVTRRKFKGLKLDARYGFAESLGSFDANATAGKEWQGGSAYVSYNFDMHDALYGRDRDFVRRFPSAVAGIPFPVTNLQCRPGNVQLLPGGTVFALPFARGTGQANTANQCDTSDGYTFYPRQTLHSVFAGVTQQLSDAVELDLRGYYLDRREWQTAGGFYQTQFVGPGFPVDSPFRPANHVSATSPFEIHQIHFAFGDADSARTNSRLRSWGLTPSITADLGKSWQLRAFASYGYSRSTLNSRIANSTALQNAITAGLFNPYDPAASDPRGLEVAQDFESYGLTRQHLYNARAVIDGSLVALPGGAVKLAFGGEFLRETLWSRNGSAVPGFANTGSPTLSLPANLPGSPMVAIRPALPALPEVRLAHNVVSLFGELVLPLFGKSNGHSGIEELTLSASARYDRYSDVGGTLNPKFGLVYRPLKWIRLRASWSKSFVAPSLVDGAEALPTQLFFVTNSTLLRPPANLIADGTWPAQRPDQNTILFIAGNQPGIVPQKSKGLSLGVDIDPPFLSGLRLSATYWNIAYSRKIGIPPLAPSLFWDRFRTSIVANPTKAQIDAVLAIADVVNNNPCAPLPGCVFAILDDRKRNIAQNNLDGFDFTAHYDRSVGFGSIDFDLSGTYLLRYQISSAPGVPLVNFAQTNTNQLRLRASLGLRTGGLRVVVSVNHSGGYRLDPPVGVAPQQTSVGGFSVVNLFARYDFKGSGLFGGLALTLNIDNLFDQNPPEWRDTAFDPQFSGYANGSTLGRFVRVGFEKKF